MLFNLGSINKDQVIETVQFPQPGETVEGAISKEALGGKGLNTSVAIQRSGGSVVHIGAINGYDDDCIRSLTELGIDTTHIELSKQPTGSAIILLDSNKENSIVVCAGANHSISDKTIENALQSGNPGDILILQNETNGHELAINIAKKKGMLIAYAAAPYSTEAVRTIIPHINLLALNQTEADALSNDLCKEIFDLPVDQILITKGADGAILKVDSQTFKVKGHKVNPKDTTAAGDTLFGYYTSGLAENLAPDKSLIRANKAASLAVQKLGAVGSIPEVYDLIENSN